VLRADLELARGALEVGFVGKDLLLGHAAAGRERNRLLHGEAAFRQARGSDAALVLDPAVEPRVYGLVQEVCTAVGAPAPRRVELNCDLNASAVSTGGSGASSGIN
jgi:hypothetical protein